MLREAFADERGVTVELEDSCDPSSAAEKALGEWGVLVLVSATGHRRAPGAGAATDGELQVELMVVENPKRNRKSGQPGPTVTSVAEAARDALHWRTAGGRCLDYTEMRRADVAEDDFRMVVAFAAQPLTGGPGSGSAAGAPEPEEILERRVAAAIAAALPGWKIVGKLTPAPEGEQREYPGTCVVVAADVASQDIDWQGPGVPCGYTVRVEVRCAAADDRSGRLFRDACRTVRAELASLLGDGCSGLDGEGFECDSFMLAGTETPLDGGDSGAGTKTYSAAVVGRFTPLPTAGTPSPQTENQEEP